MNMKLKLAGILTYAAVGLLCLTWLMRLLMGFPVMQDETLLMWALGVVIVYFIVGLGVANIGITLIEEAISDHRTRREEKQRQRQRRINSQQSTDEMTDNDGSGLSEDGENAQPPAA